MNTPELVNPFPEVIVDDVSGVEVPSQRHEDWENGAIAGIRFVLQSLLAVNGYVDDELMDRIERILKG